MKVKRQGEKVELAQGGNYTVQKIYQIKIKRQGEKQYKKSALKKRKPAKK